MGDRCELLCSPEHMPYSQFHHICINTGIRVPLQSPLTLELCTIIPENCLGIACFWCYGGFSKRQKSSEYLMAASLVFITILLLITSHYFTDMLIGAALGAYARYRYGKSARREQVRDTAARSTVIHEGAIR